MNKQFSSDIDIDFGNREDALKHLTYTAATLMRDGKPGKHASGVYFTDIPVDPFTGSASLQHERAEELGYIKLDFLNVNLYQQIRDEQHLEELMNTVPPWHRLNEREFCEQLMHLGNHYDTIQKMPEPVDSIPRLAMMLSVIRPAKRHLIGQKWADVAKTVWEKPADDGYYFKKSHSLAYATLVAVHMNLLSNNNFTKFFAQE